MSLPRARKMLASFCCLFLEMLIESVFAECRTTPPYTERHRKTLIIRAKCNGPISDMTWFVKTRYVAGEKVCAISYDGGRQIIHSIDGIIMHPVYEHINHVRVFLICTKYTWLPYVALITNELSPPRQPLSALKVNQPSTVKQSNSRPFQHSICQSVNLSIHQSVNHWVAIISYASHEMHKDLHRPFANNHALQVIVRLKQNPT